VAWIIVTDANAPTRSRHDRMLVLLKRAVFEPWLNGATESE
jgi:putative SOS response-associated peptidase YedK